MGKGISSSLPISAIAGPAHVMDLHPAGSMTSTHTGNPIACAAALASIDCIVRDDLVGRARILGELLHNRLHTLKRSHSEIGWVDGKGLVAAVAFVVPGSREPNPSLAAAVVRGCVEKGVLMFSPVGFGGGAIKICPPLMIDEEALIESIGVFEEALAECLRGEKAAAQ